jgi:hypothetical protein
MARRRGRGIGVIIIIIIIFLASWKWELGAGEGGTQHDAASLGNTKRSLAVLKTINGSTVSSDLLVGGGGWLYWERQTPVRV